VIATFTAQYRRTLRHAPDALAPPDGRWDCDRDISGDPTDQVEANAGT